MTIAVGDILKVVAIAAWLDGDIMQNVFSSEIVGAGGPFDEADIVDDAVAWVSDMFDELLASTSDEVDGSEVVVYVYDPIDDDWDEIGSGAWVWNPTSALHQMPRGVAELINCKTVDPDVNGKKYIGGTVEGNWTDGLLDASELARLVLYSTAWVQNFTGGTSGASWDPGVWSPTNTAFYGMSNTVIIPSIGAYQRRRKRGVGI